MFFIGLLILIHITWSFARQGGCDERGPICGNDGKTYGTMCQLIWARLEDTDLQVLHEGSCNGLFLSENLDPSAGEVFSGSYPGKTKKHGKGTSQKFAKLKTMMPYGWPPLGPIVTQMRELLKAEEDERKKRFSYKPKRMKVRL